MDEHQLKRQFEAEYPRLFAAIYRYVCYRVPHRPDAEDIVSDAFVSALAQLHTFDTTRGSFGQWLTGIARNKILMHWREHGRASFIELETWDGATADTSQATDDRLIVERLVATLPPETKALLALRYEDGLTYEEIAEAMGKDPAAVRKFFSRLHAKLRLEFTD